ncbi:hypothetical protein ACOJIV_27905, partial [Haloarcula sp. AONF1]
MATKHINAEYANTVAQFADTNTTGEASVRFVAVVGTLKEEIIAPYSDAAGGGPISHTHPRQNTRK